MKGNAFIFYRQLTHVHKTRQDKTRQDKTRQDKTRIYFYSFLNIVITYELMKLEMWVL